MDTDYFTKYQVYAEKAMAEYELNGRSDRFKVLQSIALKYYRLHKIAD